jgi:hypothetical protein
MTLTQVLGGVALSVMCGCETAPTAAGQPAADGIVLGLTNNNGARIWLPDGPLPCAVVDGAGNLVPVPCTMQVATPGSNSSATVLVQASGISNPTGRTVHWGPDDPGYAWAGLFYLMFGLTAPPYPCGVLDWNGALRFTLDWHATVTPEGHATVTCHLSDKDAYQFPS